jgi:hypothetical protein
MQRRKIILAGMGWIGAVACKRQEQVPLDLTQDLRSAEYSSNLIEIADVSSNEIVNPAQYLQRLSAPKFKPGHTLPPLSRFGHTLPFEARVELAKHWGYTLEWGSYATPERVAQALANPQSVEGQIMALASAQPDKYKLSIILNGNLPKTPDEIWLRDARGQLLDAKQVWSPEAPVAALQAAAKMRADPLQQICKRAPIAIVLNAGEYGLGVADSFVRDGDRDPKVAAARKGRDWFEYISERKAYQESFIAKAVRQATPDRQVYVYYPSDSNPHRGRYGGWNQWCYDYKYMRAITDRPSSSTYFKEYNSGWTGDMDMLSQVLNSVGQQIGFGDPLSYNWVCSGWARGGKDPVFGEIDRYIGFLKCYYTAGMLGGIAGYFDLPKGGFEASFPANSPPDWLLQMTALSRVHGLFSYLENYLRQGDLLPGSGQNRWSKDTSAYEFPTGDPDIRVLARKHRKKSAWLIAAWAAAGSARQVTVSLPQLGRVVMLARPSGSLYTAELVANKPKFKWFDRHEG